MLSVILMYCCVVVTLSLLCPGGKTRTKDKYRVVYTDQQRLELEKEFQSSRYITIRRKTELSLGLSLSERQVGQRDRTGPGPQPFRETGGSERHNWPWALASQREVCVRETIGEL